MGRKFRARRPKQRGRRGKSTDEIFASRTQTCRVIRYGRGKLRRRCDRLISKRQHRYTEAALYDPPEIFDIDE